MRHIPGTSYRLDPFIHFTGACRDWISFGSINHTHRVTREMHILVSCDYTGSRFTSTLNLYTGQIETAEQFMIIEQKRPQNNSSIYVVLLLIRGKTYKTNTNAVCTKKQHLFFQIHLLPFSFSSARNAISYLRSFYFFYISFVFKRQVYIILHMVFTTNVLFFYLRGPLFHFLSTHYTHTRAY